MSCPVVIGKLVLSIKLKIVRAKVGIYLIAEQMFIIFSMASLQFVILEVSLYNKILNIIYNKQLVIIRLI